PAREEPTPVLAQARRWLEAYFDGQSPEALPPLPALAPQGTSFQKSVWEILRTIPYGQTVTYGDIAARIAAERGLKSMAAQAVGHAVAKNPISILIPCHRVVGKNGSLTGYAGGIDKKIALLALEGVGVAQFSLPKGDSAL
ncbi:MAG: methylated-DNA--[protein]-cysteine S-methyltransferase, partial [Peptococcaceae bacterium]|nr:methylated-DNA--[protein]-cysteine S-methyltransferase [Peptococcaceae bacterium]